MKAVRQDATAASPVVVSLSLAPESGSALGLGARLTAIPPPLLVTRLLTDALPPGRDGPPIRFSHQPAIQNGLLTATTAPVTGSGIRWVHRVLDELHLQPTWLDGPPVVVLAGPQELLSTVRWPRFEVPDRRDAGTVAARYRRTLRDGLEHHTVRFPDPSRSADLGSTELALHLATTGSQSLVDRAFREFGINAKTAIHRSFASSGAHLGWSIHAQHPTGIAALEAAVAAVGGYLAGPVRLPPEHARQTAIDSVRSGFREVAELVREMVHYELTGWSPELLLSPESVINAIGTADLDRSLDRLVQPVLQVIGASRP